MNLQVQNQLTPFQPTKPIIKKPTIINPVNTSQKKHGESKAIRFLQWNEETKSIKLSLDLKRYNYLLRTGPAAFIIYVASKSENNYFTKFMGDKYIPLLDTTLQKGIHIWNQVIYNEHKNIQLYQLQCILGQPFKEKQFRRQSLNMVENSNVFIHAETVLMSIVAILASEVVFILYNNDDEILENFYQITKNNPNPYYKLSVINIVENLQPNVDQFKWYQLMNNIKFTVIDENRYIISSVQNIVEHPADVVFHWTLELEMTLQKKLYKTFEIDFLTFFSISEIITKTPILELENLKTVDEIFKQAITKQILYEKDDIETSYYREIKEFCSSSEEVTVESCSYKLNQLREQALSLYYMQLSQFQDCKEFADNLKSIEKRISKIELECIKLNFEIIDIELTQQFDKIEKKYKDDFPDSYTLFLTEILKFREYRGLKYQRLKKHLSSLYPSKLFDVLSQFEKEQKEKFENRMKTQNQKHLEYLNLREKELSEEIIIVQKYVDNMKKQVKNLPTLIEFENQQNIVIQKQEIIRKQNKEIELLKQSIELQVHKPKKNQK